MSAKPAGAGSKPGAAKSRPGRPADARPRSAGHDENWPAGRPLPNVVGVAVGLAALGAAVGVFSAFGHAQRVGNVTIGVPLTLAAQGGLVVAAGVLSRSRIAAGMPALGWMISVLIFAQPRSEGDLVIPADAPGVSYLLVGLVVLAGLIALPFHRFGAQPDTAGRGSKKARPAGRGAIP